MVLIRVLATLLVLQLSYAQKTSELVIGGAECSITGHRSLALVYNASGRICGGSLINQEWVLTAGHCNMKNMRIYIGVHSFRQPNWDQQRRLPQQRFFCNPSHTGEYQDIMLIRLNSPVNNSTHIAPLSLPSSSPSVGSVCRIMGWGTITSPNVTHPIVPHCANINILDRSECLRAYGWHPANSKTLCGGIPTGGINACKGDSGGPLICDGQVQGIVSRGWIPCAHPHKPVVYTKVIDYIDWIQSIIAGNTTATCPP